MAQNSNIINLSNFKNSSTNIVLGKNAGQNLQGTNAIAIGQKAGYNEQSSNSIILNATGYLLDSILGTTGGFYVAPLNSSDNVSNGLYYDTETKEILYGPLGAGPQGDTGALGPQGDTGSLGPQGDTGSLGPQGDTGSLGPQGDTGSLGPQGDTGSLGPQGATGPTGYTGAQGAQGSTLPIQGYGTTGCFLSVDPSNTSVVQYNNVLKIELVQDPSGGTGHISILPQFIDPNYTSPGLDTGINLGSNTHRFRNIYSQHAVISSNSISFINDNNNVVSTISQKPDGGLNLPAASTINGVNPGTITLLGTLNSTADLLTLTSSSIGDGYIIGSNLWVFAGGDPANANDWKDLGAVKGPQGDIGPVGPAGPIGPIGYQGFTGSQGDTGAMLTFGNKIYLGENAGLTGQSSYSIAIGYNAGQIVQQQDAVAIGNGAGQNLQQYNSVAIGNVAGKNNQQQNAIAIGSTCGHNNQQQNAIAIGLNAGFGSQKQNAIAIGYNAGTETQQQNAIAIGYNAGSETQQQNAIAIGYFAGFIVQGQNAISIGYSAGQNSQGTNAIAIGQKAGCANQTANSIILNATGDYLDNYVSGNTGGFYVAPLHYTSSASNSLYYDTITKEILYGPVSGGGGYQNAETIAIGLNAGLTGNRPGSIAIGRNAGQNYQGVSCVAIGAYAGEIGAGPHDVQHNFTVAIGNCAAQFIQQEGAVAIGSNAGRYSQQNSAISIGKKSGYYIQGTCAVAIGHYAGYTNQGQNAIAIGQKAGYTNQTANSIILNATGDYLDNDVSGNTGGFYVAPLHYTSSASNSLYYDTITKEILYGPLCILPSSTTAPADKVIGSVYFNPTNGTLYIWNGTTWIEK